MSEFGEQVDGILAKARSTWTPEEFNVIEKLLNDGNRFRLNQVMEELRGPDFKKPIEQAAE